MEKEIIQYNIPKLSFNIMIRSMAPSHSYRGLHLHDAIEIIWVSSGKLLCHIAQQQVLLEKGTILLINSNVIHRLEPLDEINVCLGGCNCGYTGTRETDLGSGREDVNHVRIICLFTFF